MQQGGIRDEQDPTGFGTPATPRAGYHRYCGGSKELVRVWAGRARRDQGEEKGTGSRGAATPELAEARVTRRPVDGRSGGECGAQSVSALQGGFTVVGSTRFRTHCHCGWCPLRLVTLGERGHFGGCILLYVGTQRGEISPCAPGGVV